MDTVEDLFAYPPLAQWDAFPFTDDDSALFPNDDLADPANAPLSNFGLANACSFIPGLAAPLPFPPHAALQGNTNAEQPPLQRTQAPHTQHLSQRATPAQPDPAPTQDRIHPHHQQNPSHPASLPHQTPPALPNSTHVPAHSHPNRSQPNAMHSPADLPLMPDHTSHLSIAIDSNHRPMSSQPLQPSVPRPHHAQQQSQQKQLQQQQQLHQQHQHQRQQRQQKQQHQQHQQHQQQQQQQQQQAHAQQLPRDFRDNLPVPFQMHAQLPLQQPSQQQFQRYASSKQNKPAAKRKAVAQQRREDQPQPPHVRYKQHMHQQQQLTRRASGPTKPIAKTKATRNLKQVMPRQGKQQRQVRHDFTMMGTSLEGRKPNPSAYSHQQQQRIQHHQHQQQHQRLQQHQTTQQSDQQPLHQAQQNMYAVINPHRKNLPAVSPISIPTPTIATGTTITGTPSATNSVHRSPPETPHSSNRKSIAVSPVREAVSEVQSSMVENTDSQIRESIQTNAKHSQSSTKLNTTSTAPRSSSDSAQQMSLSVGTPRLSKPRDKQAKLRKRLKCCTSEQMVELLVGFVRSGAVPENAAWENVAPVDIASHVARCSVLREAIYAQIPDAVPSKMDADTHRKCKKALVAFKNNIMSTGKMLQDANVWTDVIRYCVAAADVNQETPQWAEAAHNKLRQSVHTRLEQFATRAATSIGKSKVEVFTSANERMEITESCRKAFPAVAAKLDGIKRGALEESTAERMPHFDNQMMGSGRLDMAM